MSTSSSPAVFPGQFWSVQWLCISVTTLDEVAASSTKPDWIISRRNGEKFLNRSELISVIINRPELYPFGRSLAYRICWYTIMVLMIRATEQLNCSTTNVFLGRLPALPDATA